MPCFPSFSTERRGAVAMLVVCIAAIVVAYLYASRSRTGTGSEPAVRQTAQRPYAYPERIVETFDFDPNTADSTQLLRLGLAPYMVRGIYKYRGMGGVYSEPSDFMRVPGLTNEMWERLSPHIRIDRRFQRVRPEPYRPTKPRADAGNASPASTQARGETARGTQKLGIGETVELNTCDTAELKMIPGIGSYYARRIVDYRRQLGGFVSVSQVCEIDGVPQDIEQYLTLNVGEIRKIDINNATKNELLRHPYIDSFRAQSVWEYRHNRGALRGIEDLRRLMYFSEDDIVRLAPYLDFR